MTAPLRKFLVSGLGTGYLPIAPGTWGSGAAVVVYLLAWRLAPASVNLTMAAVLVLSGVACVALGRFAQDAYGRKDPSQVTVDEWAGQAMALLGLPAAGAWGALAAAGVAFVAFRFFDILKPPPIRRLERLPHGWGVLADDLLAGVYANLLSQLLLRVVFHIP